MKSHATLMNQIDDELVEGIADAFYSFDFYNDDPAELREAVASALGRRFEDFDPDAFEAACDGEEN